MKRNLLFCGLLIFFSCKKESQQQGDSQSPVILLTAPANSQAFNTGQTVTISGSISDNQRIREVHLEIINTTTGAFLTHEHYSPECATFAINKTFTAQASSAYKIKVESEDENGNKGKSEISITSN
jgi:hypothetical protein